MTSTALTPRFRCRPAQMARFMAFTLILSMIFCTWANASEPTGKIDRACRHRIRAGCENGAYDKNEWRVLPAYQPKRSWVSRHRAATVLLFLGAGVGAGIGIERATRKHCDHYPPGYSGVGVNCPKEF